MMKDSNVPRVVCIKTEHRYKRIKQRITRLNLVGMHHIEDAVLFRCAQIIPNHP